MNQIHQISESIDDSNEDFDDFSQMDQVDDGFHKFSEDEHSIDNEPENEEPTEDELNHESAKSSEPEMKSEPAAKDASGESKAETKETTTSPKKKATGSKKKRREKEAKARKTESGEIQAKVQSEEKGPGKSPNRRANGVRTRRREEQFWGESAGDSQMEFRLMELNQNLRMLYQKKNYQDMMILNLEHERNMLDNMIRSKRYTSYFSGQGYSVQMGEHTKGDMTIGDCLGKKQSYQQKFESEKMIGYDDGAKLGERYLDPYYGAEGNFHLTGMEAPMMHQLGGFGPSLGMSGRMQPFGAQNGGPENGLFVKNAECIDIREDTAKKADKKGGKGGAKGPSKAKRNRAKKSAKSGEAVIPVKKKKYNIRTKYVLDDDEKYQKIQFKPTRKKEKKKIEKEPIPSMFTNLYEVLIGLLFDENIKQAQLDRMSDNELQLLRSFMLKKKMIKQSTDLIITSEAINTHRSNLSKKRVEENLKYVFKFCLKFLKIEFRNKNDSFRFRKEDLELTNKNLIDLGFFIHYFGEIADNLGWPISKFFHPKVLTTYDCKKFANVLDNYEERPKTINKEYVEAVCMSGAFMNDFKNYITDCYLVGNEYTGIIRESKECALEKIKLKLVQWSKLILATTDEKKIILKIKSDLEDQNKCKLPWSVAEVRRAVEEAKKLLKMKKTTKRPL